MYDSTDDPYCYPGTTVLKNRRNLRTQEALDRFETAITAQRFDEPLPGGKLTEQHYRRVHRHLFKDVYDWAGKYRTVRISKGDSAFCYPENIQREMASLFAKLRRDDNLRGLSKQHFAQKGQTFYRISMRFTRFGTAMAAAKWPSWHYWPRALNIRSVSRGWSPRISWAR